MNGWRMSTGYMIFRQRSCHALKARTLFADEYLSDRIESREYVLRTVAAYIDSPGSP